VIDETTGDTTHFHYDKWLGFSDSGGTSGPLTIHLFPSHEDLTQRKSNSTPSKFPVRFQTGAACFPHPHKVEKGQRGLVNKNHGHAGEDAFFVTHGAIGIADGVFGWHDTEASMYSRALIDKVREFSEQKEKESSNPLFAEIDPFESLIYSHQHLSQNKIKGSSTALVMALSQQKDSLGKYLPILRSANLGDGSFLIIRYNPTTKSPDIFYRSPQQDKSVNNPYSLGHHRESDTPHDAMQASIPLQEGDIVVAGTDGLFDNLHDEEISDLLHQILYPSASSSAASLSSSASSSASSSSSSDSSSSNRCPSTVATKIAKTAFARSMSRSATTPYSLAISNECNGLTRGGKLDDITVLVAFVEHGEV